MATTTYKWDMYWDKVTEKCLEHYEQVEEKNPWELATDIMDIEGFPMHCPVHHYLIPAVLLTACRKARRAPEDQLRQGLEEAKNRAQKVLPGFCGLFGACGTAVGVGIFMSIFTETTPYSGASWSTVNEATARCLLHIAEIEGPRCCKRTTYLALECARDIIEEKLGIALEKPERVKCKYSKQNNECKGSDCPFYSGEEEEK